MNFRVPAVLACLVVLLTGCQSSTDTLSYAIVWQPDRVPELLQSDRRDIQREIEEEQDILRIATTWGGQSESYTRSDLVVDLLKRGADPNNIPERQRAQFLSMLLRGTGGLSPEAIASLLDHGLDPSAAHPDHTPWRALIVNAEEPFSQHGYQVIANALVRNGVDLNPRDLHDETPLINALSFFPGQYHARTKIIARALINAGADLTPQDRDGNTALHLAIRYSDADIVQALIDAGAPLDIANKRGQTPYERIMADADLRERIRMPERLGTR